jgi:TPR repeat protein
LIDYDGVHWLEKAAKAGYAKAQDALGRAYHQGVGVRQDRKEALRWFRLAGEQGHPVAQTNAGVIYERDFYLCDYELAARWYERAAKAGYAPAMIHLGDLYQFGEGVPRSFTIAQSWYAVASKSDDPKIAGRARERMRAGMARSLELDVAVFCLGDRFPTPGQLFDAVIAAGIAEKVLYPDAGRAVDPDLQAAYDEIDRTNRAGQQRWNDLAMDGLTMAHDDARRRRR